MEWFLYWKAFTRRVNKNLKCAKQASLDYKELIEKFYNEISALKTSIEVDYEKLPIALKENEEIKRKVLAIKEENIEK